MIFTFNSGTVIFATFIMLYAAVGRCQALLTTILFLRDHHRFAGLSSVSRLLLPETNFTALFFYDLTILFGNNSIVNDTCLGNERSLRYRQRVVHILELALRKSLQVGKTILLSACIKIIQQRDLFGAGRHHDLTGRDRKDLVLVTEIRIAVMIAANAVGGFDMPGL